MQGSYILVLAFSPFYQGNLAAASATAADNKNVHNEQHTSDPIDSVPLAPQGVVEPFMGTPQPPSQGQFQFPGPRPLVRSIPSPSPIPIPLNSLTPVNNLLHQHSMPLNPPNLPLPFGSQPADAGVNLPPNQSQFVQNPYANHPRPSDIRVPPGNPVLQPLQPSPSSFPSSVARPLLTQGPRPMFSHPNIASSGSISNTSMANTNPLPVGFSSGPFPPTSLGGPLNRANLSAFPSASPSASQPLPVNNSPQGMTNPRGNPLNSSLGPGASQLPSRLSLPPFESGLRPNFPPMRSSSVAAPQNPNFGDFTFQPHHQPQMPRFLPPNVAPQAPPFRSSAIPDFHPRPELFPRPPIQGRFPFPNVGPSMGEMNSGPTARSPYLGQSAFPMGPGNPMEPRRIFRLPMNQADMHLPPSQQFNRTLPFVRPGPGNREPQIYDPFSPTSASNMPRHHGDNSSGIKRRENDPEYEDLMASVGVK